MYEYLVKHALENVWCGGTQDNQLVFSPKRITPARGALNFATVLGDSLELPVKKKPVHLFQIGQLDPFTIGLLRQVPHWRTQKWFKFSEAVNFADLEVTIYNANGVNLPRTDCYYIFLDDRALIFAVPDQPAFKVNLEQEQIYFRFYKNAYYNQDSGLTKNLSCGYFSPITTKDVLEMEQFLESLRLKKGGTRTYVNGLLSNAAVLGHITAGDYVEWVYDSSVKKIVDLKLSDLHQFRSELDNVYKYLLHYEESNNSLIDFQDDIDIHILIKDMNGFYKGVYYNRNQEYFHRMVTHKDYSIATQPVVSLKDNLSRILGQVIPSSDKVFIQLSVREAGTDKTLIFETNRIFELYKLENKTVTKALIGLDSNVPEWNCVELEKSYYNWLMRLPRKDVNIEAVQKAYGYNACSVILAETPTKTVFTSGNQIANIPYGLQKGSTVYEFDGNGFLLGFHAHFNDNDYEAKDANCRLVEAVIGLPSQTTDSVYGRNNIPLPEAGNSYRVYRCYTFDGLPNNNWEDITDTNEYFIENKVLKWKGLETNQWLMVRGDRNILAYDYEVSQNDGLLNFTILENPSGNPVDDLEPLVVPLAQLDIWLNKRKLIEGLDFFIKFPLCFITNKTFLNQPVNSSKQNIHVRMMGLPSKTMLIETAVDTGWVLNGSLSNNCKFDLRDDKVQQINIGGSIKHQDDLVFAEDRPVGDILNKLNGLPYQIKDLIVPLRGSTQEDTYKLREIAKNTDRRISDYMTLKFGAMESNKLSAITSRYPVVSPFFSHIVHLLLQKSIVLPSDKILSVPEVMEICKVYENLLDWDPLTDVNSPNENFAYIIPHANHLPYGLDFLAYRFLTQAIEVYGNGKISITDYININKA